MVTADYKLFTPLTIGKDLVLKNRVVMGPMTRARSDPVTREATELNATYYEQRAGAGLIISEATAVSEQGHGWYGTPALYTSGQAAAWKNVVDRVHLKGGKIFAQLWHMGRVAHPSFNSKNEVVSASAIRLEDGHLRNVKGEHVPYETPRALLTEEIPDVVEDYCRSAQFAKDAGFDGIELHAANGYLIDQFLQSSANKRTDKYGGSIENRARFLLELVEAVKTVWPADRIGVRLSPNGGFSGMGNADNPEQFTYVLTMLGEYGLAYVALLDGVGFGYHDKARLLTVFDAKLAFKGLVLANNSYTRDIAEGAVRSGTADFVSFGRPFISNPDLAERFANDWPLNPDASYEAYWTSDKGAEGYIDFPAYQQ
jgi:2,4-dienoyl-CoA reductase-like NADH-dependent reductase (Old Yellow Enzyme family)